MSRWRWTPSPARASGPRNTGECSAIWRCSRCRRRCWSSRDCCAACRICPSGPGSRARCHGCSRRPAAEVGARRRVGLAIVCLALAIFYASAARARIALLSTVVGGALGAVLLAAVLWVFARLQIGASHVGALESGMAAVPVFLLWSFSSWFVVLIGAQVAVAHELDGILIHGAAPGTSIPTTNRWRGCRSSSRPRDARCRRRTTARPRMSWRAGSGCCRKASARSPAGCWRAGLIQRTDAGRFRLACDPDRTSLRDVVGAIIGRPADEAAAGPRAREPVRRCASWPSGKWRIEPE